MRGAVVIALMIISVTSVAVTAALVTVTITTSSKSDQEFSEINSSHLDYYLKSFTDMRDLCVYVQTQESLEIVARDASIYVIDYLEFVTDQPVGWSHRQQTTMDQIGAVTQEIRECLVTGTMTYTMP